eukprot:8969233-Pyramimonas_sp.AAC.2
MGTVKQHVLDQQEKWTKEQAQKAAALKLKNAAADKFREQGKEPPEEEEQVTEEEAPSIFSTMQYVTRLPAFVDAPHPGGLQSQPQRNRHTRGHRNICFGSVAFNQRRKRSSPDFDPILLAIRGRIRHLRI